MGFGAQAQRLSEQKKGSVEKGATVRTSSAEVTVCVLQMAPMAMNREEENMAELNMVAQNTSTRTEL